MADGKGGPAITIGQQARSASKHDRPAIRRGPRRHPNEKNVGRARQGVAGARADRCRRRGALGCAGRMWRHRPGGHAAVLCGAAPDYVAHRAAHNAASRLDADHGVEGDVPAAQSASGGRRPGGSLGGGQPDGGRRRCCPRSRRRPLRRALPRPGFGHFPRLQCRVPADRLHLRTAGRRVAGRSCLRRLSHPEPPRVVRVVRHAGDVSASMASCRRRR